MNIHDILNYDSNGVPTYAHAGWSITAADITHAAGRVNGIELTAPSDRNVYVTEWGSLPASGGNWVALSPRDATVFTHDDAVQSERVSEFGGITSTSVLTTGTVAIANLPEGANYDRGWCKEWTGTGSDQQPVENPNLFFFVPAGKIFPIISTASTNVGKSLLVHWIEVPVLTTNMRY